MPNATITALTNHVDSKACHDIIELAANQVELVVNSESLFSFNPTTYSLPDWWRRTARKQCRAIVSIRATRLASWQQVMFTVRD